MLRAFCDVSNESRTDIALLAGHVVLQELVERIFRIYGRSRFGLCGAVVGLCGAVFGIAAGRGIVLRSVGCSVWGKGHASHL